jgi:hypothetical protein
MIHEKKIEIPDDILNDWQTVVDLMAKPINVPAGLIMLVSFVGNSYISVLRAFS